MGHGGVHHMDPGHMGQCSAACLHAMSCTPDVPIVGMLYIAAGLMLQSAACTHSHCTKPVAHSMPS